MQSIIMTLDKRIHLAEELEQQCRDKGFDVKKFISGDGLNKDLQYDNIDFFTTPDIWQWGTGISALRHYRAFLTHKAIIKYAIKKQLDGFLLLEDDSYFLDRYDEILDKLNYEDIYHQSCDLLYLGWHAFEFNGDYAVGKNIEIEKNWAEEKKCEVLPINFNVGGFHAVYVNSSAYATLLNFSAITPMDSQCNYSNLNRAMIIPKLLHVRSCHSYCENRFVQRESLT